MANETERKMAAAYDCLCMFTRISQRYVIPQNYNNNSYVVWATILQNQVQ